MDIKRRFIIGEEWLYLKIYSGPKSIDKILLEDIMPLAEREFNAKNISKFFFVRYASGGEHVRLRFELRDVSFAPILIKELSACLVPYVKNRIVSEVSVNTYNRELERYGLKTIEDFETIFCSSSFDVLKIFMQTEDYQMRWLLGVKWLDELFNKFNLTLWERHALYDNHYLGFLKEFGQFNVNKDVLKRKYREVSGEFANIMKQSYPLFAENGLNTAIENILKLHSINKLERPLYNLMADIVHMHFNRMFRVNARTYELVLSYMLSNYYKSEMIRTKKSLP